MTGGILLAIGGVWLGCQVVGGDALARLGVTGTPQATGGAPAPAAKPAPVKADAGIGGALGDVLGNPGHILSQAGSSMLSVVKGLGGIL